ncbi:glycosyltransferase [Sphingobacterium humi]|uniref:Glycosyltransferase n=1 Tax=Sphingobacterium humi TaxID=1796905 RepID=A0A6N8KXS9_9SPHI|nr:glycosyltransferase family 4 protein [Sphingobacterium humi]MVZ61897.1 glycosyltransferase [Sphingobacterium humi]
MGKRLLIIGLVWPEPTSSAAGWHMLELIRSFRTQDYELHFACAAAKSPHSFPLTDWQVQEHEIQLNDSGFDAWVKDLHPDIVLFDRFMVEEQYSWRVKEACPQALLLLDTEDLHGIRAARQAAYKIGRQVQDADYLQGDSLREIASILRCDLSLIISPTEMALLDRVFRINPSLLFHLPFYLEPEERQTPSFKQRQHFMFIGNFIHEPNWKTVQVLKELWPSIRKQLPKAELHIYGAYASQKVLQLHHPASGFLIKGRVEEAISCMEQYRLLLAPIPFGAGLKGKFIDALRAGTVSISSSIGAEGLSQDGLWQGLITDDRETFIQESIALYESETAWQEAQQRGKHLWEKLDSRAHYAAFLTLLPKLQENLEMHRRHNIMGQLLWNNQYNARKYMSLWIEQKNKA